MTRPDRLNRNDRRELERELRDVPTPPAPADLLERIREEIPEHLPAANQPAPAAGGTWFRRPAFRLAATIAVAALGVTLAWRTLESRAADETTPQETRANASADLATEAPFAQSPASGPTGSQPKVTNEVGPPVEEKLAMKGKTDDGRAGERAAGEAARPDTPSLESRVEGGARAVDSVDAEQQTALRDNARELSRRLRRVEPEAGGDLGALGSAGGAKPSEPEPRKKAGLAGKEERQTFEEEVTVVGRNPVVDRSSSSSSTPVNESGEAEPGRNQSERRRLLHKKVPKPSPAAPPSTGGTAEPNDRAYGVMFFRPTGTNPFVDTAEDRLSTFALDVDTGSYTLARSYLERGTLPPPEAIRVEEFVNAQRYDDPAPRRGEFTLIAEGAPSPFAPSGSYRLVRFAVKARELLPEDRKSAVLTFVVDVSGSMNRENRLGLVKRALDLLLDELRRDDEVALVVYGSRGHVLLSHTRDHEAIRAAIARLRPEGSTNAEEGLRLGYDLADRSFRSGAINRVILCSDGVANVGATGPESILARIGTEARRGIELTTVGFGMGNYNDALMEQLADQGDGAYHYVDTLEEARKVFVENLTGMLQTVAKDAKVQVEFDPGTVDRWRLLGYENRDVADRDFRNDSIDAGEVGVGHSATALYEIRLKRGARGNDRLATLKLRWKSVEAGRVIEAHQDLTVRDLGRSFDRSSRDLRVAAVAAELAERLKQTYWAKDGTWSELVREARSLERDEPRDDGVRALADLVERAARLAGDDPRPIRRDGPLDDER